MQSPSKALMLNLQCREGVLNTLHWNYTPEIFLKYRFQEMMICESVILTSYLGYSNMQSDFSLSVLKLLAVLLVTQHKFSIRVPKVN